MIPCFNEERGLPQLFSKLESAKTRLQSNFEVELVFIDDGSTDATHKILSQEFRQARNVKIVRHSKNCGLGAALRTGFSKATGDIIVTIDSDCSYDPREIPKLIYTLDKETDIAVGSPYHPDGKTEDTSFLRLLLSKSLSKIYRILLSSGIHTYTGIFRAYRRDVIRGIHFQANDFLSLSEILARAILRGYRIREYPTTLYYRKFGRSKLKVFRMILRHLRFILSLIFNKRGFLHEKGIGDE